MPSEGPIYPLGGASWPRSGSSIGNWTNGGNVVSDNNAFVVTTATAAQGYSAWLVAGRVGTGGFFDIPLGATPTGLVAEVGRRVSGGGASYSTSALQLRLDTTFIGTAKSSATLWAAIEQNQSFGSASDDWGLGAAFTRDLVNEDRFHIGLSVNKSGAQTTNFAEVDYIRLTLHYNLLNDETASDTLTIGVSETAGVMVLDDGLREDADTLALALTETADVIVQAGQADADTLTIGVDETAALLVTLLLAASDDLTLGVDDAGAFEVVPIPAAVLLSAIEAPVYHFILRDPRTLAQIGRLVWFEAVTWTRRLYELSDVKVRIHDDDVPAEALDADVVLEIRRNGVAEWSGLLDIETLDDASGFWTLQGLDLRTWLSFRDVWPPAGLAYDAVSSVAAETAVLTYVDHSIVNPVDGERSLAAELDGLDFELQFDLERGATVSYNARYINLLTAAHQLARDGDLIVEVGFQTGYAGYRLEVREPENRAQGQPEPTIFGVERGTATNVRYEVNRRGHRNTIAALGQGAGDTRTVEVRQDAGDVAAHFRREGTVDSRNNDSATLLQQDADARIAQSRERVQTVELEPDPVRAPYRTTWDLGDDVTVVVPRRGVALDKRITEVQVSVDRRRGETVRVTLGNPPATEARIVRAALNELNRVQRD